MGYVEDLRGKKQGQGRARYRDPSGRERPRSFARKVDAERFLVSVEDAKLRGAYVDPAAGRVPFSEWAERWQRTTATLRPSTRKDYERKEMHFLTAAQVETLADSIAPPYGVLNRPPPTPACGRVSSSRSRSAALTCCAGRFGWPRLPRRLPGIWSGAGLRPIRRTVRLPRSVAEELGGYLAGRPHGPGDLVFTAPRGGPLRESKFVPGRFKPAIGAANEALAQLDPDGRPAPLPEELRLYDLRHTAASLMIRQGASVKAVQRQLGHATASITLDTYGHLFPDELDALAGRLEDARADALATLARTQHGPTVVPIHEGAGQ
jgi:integrase